MSVLLRCGGQLRLLFRECLGYLCGVWMKGGCIPCLEYVLLRFPSSQHEQRTGKISSGSQLGKFRVGVNQGCKLQNKSDFVFLVRWELQMGHVVFLGEALSYPGTETPFHVTLQMFMSCGTVRALQSSSLPILSPSKGSPLCTDSVIPRQKTSIFCLCLLWEKNKFLVLSLLLPFVLT